MAESSKVAEWDRRLAETNLTQLQLLYWIGHKLRPSSSHVNNAFSFHIPLALDTGSFQQAFAATAHRFDALRTIVEECQGVPRQRVLPAPPEALEFVDLSQHPEPFSALQTWLQDRVARPFDLRRCLYDSALIELTETRFVWFLNQHHLITDAASFFLVAKAVFQHYEALRQGVFCPVVKAPEFATYLNTEQRFLSSSRAATSQGFWRDLAAQKPASLPFYGQKRQKNSDRVHRRQITLGGTEAAALEKLAERIVLDGATLELRQFCLTAAVFFALLHQLTGKREIGFVTTLHNRSTKRARETAGPLMELCPVLVTISKGETFKSLTEKVAVTMKDLLRHYRYGASRAVSELSLDCLFSYVERPLLTLENEVVIQEIVHPGSGSESLALHAHRLAGSDQFELYLDLHEDIFDSAQQEHALNTLQWLIKALLEDPQTNITRQAIPWPERAGKRKLNLNGLQNGRTRSTYVPPSTPMELELQQIWQEVLGQSPISVQDDFFHLGGESWQAMSLLGRYEALTGRRLPLAALLSARTIADLAGEIQKNVTSKFLVQIQPGRVGEPPLFLFPGAAGNVMAMERLGRHLAPHQPVYTFNLPAYDAATPPPAEIDKLVPQYLQAILAVHPQGPFCLAGYSAGGIVAFETAQQLRHLGKNVPFLAIIDMPAPNLAYRHWWRLSQAIAKLLSFAPQKAENLYLRGRDAWSRTSYFWRRGLWVWLRLVARIVIDLWHMPLFEKWHHVLGVAKKVRSQRIPAADSHNLPPLQDMDPAGLPDPRVRALFDIYDRAARKYLPKPYAGRITLLRCPLGYGRKEIRSPHPQYGWQLLTNDLETHEIEADGHLALVREPGVSRLGAQLQKSLLHAINSIKEDRP